MVSLRRECSFDLKLNPAVDLCSDIHVLSIETTVSGFITEFEHSIYGLSVCPLCTTVQWCSGAVVHLALRGSLKILHAFHFHGISACVSHV